jgi:lysine 2,3-aminomutase
MDASRADGTHAVTTATPYRKALHTADDLIAAGLVDRRDRAVIETVGATYAIALTDTVVHLIDRSDCKDPIARQFVPSAAELEIRPEEKSDPIGDAAFSPVDGIVHRYPDRVLLKLLHVCPVYCRFCFRRASVGPGSEAYLDDVALDAAFAYIAAKPEIWEVILTGGDPLTLSLRRLEDVLRRLAAIDHVKILRIHTRIPCVDPAAITPDLIDALKACGKTVYVALHANHPRELTVEARAACALFIDAGIPMVSQSVLLRGVNDEVATLEALFRAFVECRIKPYYLHQLDLAPGTSHFRVPIVEGQNLMGELQGRVSGLCLPKYMLDIPGGHGKVPIETAYLTAKDRDGTFQVTDRYARIHTYPPFSADE